MKLPSRSDLRVWSLSILGLLIGTNLIWALLSRGSGPKVAMLFYSLILFLYWKHHDTHAALVGGCVGFCVHVLEWLLQDLSAFSSLDWTLFMLNLLLPLPLAFLGWREIRKG